MSTRAPHVIDLPTGGSAFIHPCEVCGNPYAPFGYGVSLRNGKPGYWRCSQHREENRVLGVDKTSTSVKCEVTESTPPVPKRAAEPLQGDLF